MKKIGLIIFLLGIILFAGFWFWKKESKPISKGGEKIRMEEKKSGKVLFVIAPQNFRDEEYQRPRQVLEQAGWQVEVASRQVKEAKGMLGAKVSVDKDISQVNIDDYEGIIFVGGTGAAVYFEDQTALSIAKTAYEKGKVVGAICIAPSILANAGILQGKNATSFPSEEENLKNHGANYTGLGVTVDGKIVTASGPQAAEEFGQKLVEVLP